MNDQRSTEEQLRDLVKIADREGMYDAADWLKNILDSDRAKS